MTTRTLAWATPIAALVALAGCSAPKGDTATAPVASAPAGAPRVSGGGFTLVSTTIALPEDAARFPTAAGSDLLEANCASCHSASMVLQQPPLKPEQWQATVKKMREVYKAPIAERDVPALLGYLSALSARRANPPAS